VISASVLLVQPDEAMRSGVGLDSIAEA